VFYCKFETDYEENSYFNVLVQVLVAGGKKLCNAVLVLKQVKVKVENENQNSKRDKKRNGDEVVPEPTRGCSGTAVDGSDSASPHPLSSGPLRRLQAHCGFSSSPCPWEI